MKKGNNKITGLVNFGPIPEEYIPGLKASYMYECVVTVHVLGIVGMLNHENLSKAMISFKHSRMKGDLMSNRKVRMHNHFLNCACDWCTKKYLKGE